MFSCLFHLKSFHYCLKIWKKTTNNDLSIFVLQEVECITVLADLQCVALDPFVTTSIGACRPSLGSQELDQTHGVETDLYIYNNSNIVGMLVASIEQHPRCTKRSFVRIMF